MSNSSAIATARQAWRMTTPGSPEARMAYRAFVTILIAVAPTACSSTVADADCTTDSECVALHGGDF